jgi:hypothetical protein
MLVSHFSIFIFGGTRDGCSMDHILMTGANRGLGFELTRHRCRHLQEQS